MTKLVKVTNIDDEYLQEIVDSCTMIDEKVKQKMSFYEASFQAMEAKEKQPNAQDVSYYELMAIVGHSNAVCTDLAKCLLNKTEEDNGTETTNTTTESEVSESESTGQGSEGTEERG